MAGQGGMQQSTGKFLFPGVGGGGGEMGGGGGKKLLDVKAA